MSGATFRGNKAALRHFALALQVKNLARMNAAQRQQVVERASAIRRGEVGMVGLVAHE